MTQRRFSDEMVHDGRIRATDDGAVMQARVARANNVQVYLGAEVGMPDREVVRVYRPADAVFDKAAISTYARKPITIGHPENGVSPETWRDLAVGEIDRDVMRDGEFVSVPLLFRDAKAIAMLQAADGPRELSMGYDAQITMQDGVSPSGEAFDAVMSDFRMNHVAVVTAARGGEALRIGDGADAGKDRAWGASPITDRKDVIMADAIQTRTVLIDGLSVVTTDAGAQALEKLNKTIADMSAEMTAYKKKAKEDEAEAEKATAAKDAEIADLKSKVLTEDAKAAMIAGRVALEATAARIAADVTPVGLADAALRKAVVVARLGDAMADKSDAYIDARFEILAEDAAKAPGDVALKAGIRTQDAAALWDSIVPMKGV